MKRVYLIHAVGTDKYKIGTTSNLDARLRNLQTASALPLSVLATTPGDEHVEREIHALVGSHRVYGEWFEFRTESAELKLLQALFRSNGDEGFERQISLL